jgi:hypothetical protein
MSGYQYGIITVWEYIDCGLRLRLGAVRTLKLYREMGGKIQTKEFLAQWHQEQDKRSTREQQQATN